MEWTLTDEVRAARAELDELRAELASYEGTAARLTPGSKAAAALALAGYEVRGEIDRLEGVLAMLRGGGL